MRQIKTISFLVFLMALFSCIKPYDPNIEGDETSKLVVSGRITGNEGYQEVNVSMASTVQDAQYLPVSGCMVNILDNKGNIFSLPEEENEAGTYRTWINGEYLTIGTAYMVSVVTPDGERIESSYDTLTRGAPMDSVYYLIEEVPTPDPDINETHMQFYVDLRGSAADCRNYKWDILETWEYHAAHPLEFYYDGKFHEVIPPDYSKFKCWTNIPVKDIFLVSTAESSENSALKQPLHYIDGTTSRLDILYSILVTQESLSASSYKYFDVVKSNGAGFGGLYEKQPFSISGNLVNLTHPEKDVLGYFYACSQSTRRYFYHDIEGIVMDYWNQCNEDPLPISGWQGFKKNTYPVYYYYLQSGALRILSDDCVECNLRGGTTSKPDFWPI